MLKQKFSAFARQFTLAAAAVTISASAHAGLIGVKSIEISNALNDWLQVAEVVALNTSNADVALTSFGATASAPDSWNANSTPDKAINGITNGAFSSGIFHEGSPRTGDTLTITLPSVQELVSLAIYGRSDPRCSNRDFYDAVLKDVSGNILQTVSIDARNANHVGSVTFATNNVPEPGSLLLIGAALVGLGAIRRAH